MHDYLFQTVDTESSIDLDAASCSNAAVPAHVDVQKSDYSHLTRDCWHC